MGASKPKQSFMSKKLLKAEKSLVRYSKVIISWLRKTEVKCNEFSRLLAFAITG